MTTYESETIRLVKHYILPNTSYNIVKHFTNFSIRDTFHRFVQKALLAIIVLFRYHLTEPFCGMRYALYFRGIS